MKRIFVSALFSTAVLLNYCVAFSQEVKTRVVNMNLSSLEFEDALPFDEPFKIKVKIDKTVRKVEFKYRIKNGEYRDWHYFPKSGTTFTEPCIRERPVGGSDDTFILDCGPLHPNVDYEFSFILFTTIALTEDKKKELNAAMLKTMKSTLASSQVTHDRIESLAAVLNTMIQSALQTNGKFVDLNNRQVTVKPFEEPLKHVSDSIVLASLNIAGSTANIATRRTSIPLVNAAVREPIAARLFDIINGKVKLSPIAKNLYESPLDPSIEGFSTTACKDVALVIAQSLAGGVGIEKILTGDSRIAGTALQDNTGSIHIPSIQLLRSFFMVFSSSFMVEEGTNTLIFGAQASNINTTVTKLDKFLDELALIKSYNESMNKLISEFPDLFLNTFISQEFLTNDRSNIDVTSEKTPYVGLDVGVVYAGKLNSFFTYQGANIYFVPVNKRAPLTSFKGGDKFLKMFSLYIGISQNITRSNSKRYEDLIDGTGSFLIGFGFRFNRIARLNVGQMLYMRKDENPIISEDLKLRSVTTISLSVDLNIAKAFGDIGKALKFP